MSEHKKKFYQVPFNDALVGFLYILAHAMYFEFLPILYRKIVDPLAPFDVRWLFCSFALGAFGLVFIVMTLWKIADKLPFGFLSVLCRCLGVIVGIPSVILIAIPMIHLLVPYYITRFFLKITGHTAAKKLKKKKRNSTRKIQIESTGWFGKRSNIMRKRNRKRPDKRPFSRYRITRNLWVFRRSHQWKNLSTHVMRT